MCHAIPKNGMKQNSRTTAGLKKILTAIASFRFSTIGFIPKNSSGVLCHRIEYFVQFFQY